MIFEMLFTPSIESLMHILVVANWLTLAWLLWLMEMHGRPQ
ncbi:MAG: hypothetical protein AB7P49_17065 [Bdellovibrionales bacterium]